MATDGTPAVRSAVLSAVLSAALSTHTTAQTTRSWQAAQLGDPPGDFFLGEPLPMRGGDTDDSVLLHWPTPSRPQP